MNSSACLASYFLGPSGLNVEAQEVEHNGISLVKPAWPVYCAVCNFFQQRGCTRPPQPLARHLTICSGQESHLAKAHLPLRSHAFAELPPESPPQQDMVSIGESREKERRWKGRKQVRRGDLNQRTERSRQTISTNRM